VCTKNSSVKRPRRWGSINLEWNTNQSINQSTLAGSSGRWWVDNGATQHVTHCADYFTDFEEFKISHKVKAAGGELLQAVGKGTIPVRSHDGKIMTLNDVWYVPQISKNLFSVLAAHDRNTESTFVSETRVCRFEVKNKVVFRGYREMCGSLYEADFKPVRSSCQSELGINERADSLLQLYHERWGHQDKRHVRDLLSRELDIHVKLNKELCEPCVFGKLHRSKFGSRKATTRPGELVSADVIGPFDNSYRKYKYVVIFKDDYSKFKYGFFLRKKSEVPVALKKVILHAEALGHRVQDFLSDNGGEFDSEKVRRILTDHGINQRLTAPYCPNQNGGSERENRTIIEMARTLKYANPAVEFPRELWAELVSSAIYILNRTGKSSVAEKTPFDLWMQRKPRIKHLRVIGCLCYVEVPRKKRRRMDKKAKKGYLIGYDGEERYRVYLREQNKVITSRDVQFHERLTECRVSVKLPLKDLDTEDRESIPDSSVKRNLTKSGKDFNEAGEKDNATENESFEETTQQDSKEDSRFDPSLNSKEGSSTEESRWKSFLRNPLQLKKPAHLQDYATCIEVFSVFETPQTYKEAIESDQSAEWRKAMESEIASLKANDTWEIVDLPKGAKAIPCRWVYRVKETQTGEIERYKARLVIKGFNQRYGIDYKETFSPVAKLATIRSILSVAANEGLHLGQFDVTTAFLYGELEECIFMQQPPGYETGNAGKVCKLKRSLYGLKQAPRCWNKRFITYIRRLGMKISEADPCLFIRESNREKLLLAVYVDDGLMAASNELTLKDCLRELQLQFKITSKPATYFLGIDIKREGDSIKISQALQTRKILERFNMAGCRPVSTPMLRSSESGKVDRIEEAEEADDVSFPYRQAVGAIMYLMLGSRPDLAYSIGVLSRTLENPSKENVVALKRVLRYLAGSIESGIIYTRTGSEGILEGYSDSDYGGCCHTGRSTSGVVVKYAGGAISWYSQRQASVATSTTEAEVIAASEAAKEMIWLKRLFLEITTLDKSPPYIYVDNSAAVRLSQNPEFHRRTKHISLRHFYIRERVIEKELQVQQISTERQVADIMTKPLLRQRHEYLCKLLGMRHS
jgi:transposase InsO family protein